MMSSTIEECIACSCLITTERGSSFLLLDLTLIISNVTAESIMLRQNRFSMKSAVALIFSDCIFVVNTVYYGRKSGTCAKPQPLEV